MDTATFPVRTASSRKAKRDHQYASTLVHYLGVQKALDVCKENTWTGVRHAILEQETATTH